MKNFQELKDEKQNKVTALIDQCGMFFAFNDEQFNESKTPLQEGEKYISLGFGCYLPNSQVKNWIDGNDNIDNWFKSEIKSNKARRDHIIYELAN